MPEKTTYSGQPQQLRLGIDAVIFDDQGRVLLHRRDDNGDWGCRVVAWRSAKRCPPP